VKKLLVIVDVNSNNSALILEAMRFCAGIAIADIQLNIYLTENSLQTISENSDNYEFIQQLDSSIDTLKKTYCSFFTPKKSNTAFLNIGEQTDKIDIKELAEVSLQCDYLIRF
jgi:hypothetical protein